LHPSFWALKGKEGMRMTLGTEERKYLNIVYAIYPTGPQAYHFDKINEESKLQINRGVINNRKLYRSFLSQRFEYVVEQLLSSGKNDDVPKRRDAIERLCEELFPSVKEPRDKAALYDLFKIFNKGSSGKWKILFPIKDIYIESGKVTSCFFDDLREKLVEDFKVYRENGRKYRKWRKNNKNKPKDERESRPKRKDTPYIDCIGSAIKRRAGYAAKVWMDHTFIERTNRQGATNRGAVRFATSGSDNPNRWNSKTKPSPKQRKQGNRGIPRRQKINRSYEYQETRSVDKIFYRNHSNKWRVKVKGIPKGMESVAVKVHRPFPTGGRIKKVLILKDSFDYYPALDRWFIVVSVQLGEEAGKIEPGDMHKYLAIDPGIKEGLTGVIFDAEQDEFDFYNYRNEFQKEVQEEIDELNSEADTRYRSARPKKGIKPSRNWSRMKSKIRRLQRQAKNKRKHFMHEETHRLVTNYGNIAMGEWTPSTEKEGRKAFKEGLADEVKPGRIGIRSERKKVSDLSLGSYRRMLDEKGGRAGIQYNTNAEEAYSTVTCCVCNEETGPEGDPSVRKWTCESCGMVHDRELNGSMNILRIEYGDELGIWRKGKMKKVYVSKYEKLREDIERYRRLM